MNKAIRYLVPLVAALSFFAALAGLWPAQGTPYQDVSFRGETVTINAQGLYYWDTVSSAAQMQANDLITLVLGVPLLLVSWLLALRGSLRGKLILSGNLGYILYTYITMAFGAQFNALFPVYVALFGLSLFSLVLVLLSIDLPTLPGVFSERLPRRGIAALLFFAAFFLVLAWGGRIAAAYKPGAIPLLENTTSMFIQALDLGVVVPLCVLAGIMLLRAQPWGYLLASVGLVKFSALGVAVSLMGLNMLRLGVTVSPAELIVFPCMALAGILMTLLLFIHIRETARD